MGRSKNKKALRWCGWLVGISYCAPQPGGVTHDHLHHLLEEMASHGMNYLSLMMQSYAYFDPEHDGYAWPVSNPRLAGYIDERNINAKRESEFVSRVLHEAERRGVAVEMTLNWGIWNNARIAKTYPDACLQHGKDGRPLAGSLHCPDSPGAWRLGLDEVDDLLSFYGKYPALKRFAFERISYAGRAGCYCPYTRAACSPKHAKPLERMPTAEMVRWKAENIGRKITEFTSFIKARFPRVEVGCSTVGNPHWGHDPARFSEWGIDYVQPHTIQFKTGKRQLHRTWAHLSPNPMVLHFDLRDRAPQNYPIWQKTPKIIKQVLSWVRNAPCQHIDGIVFFNEPVVSPQNRQAMYDALEAGFHVGE
ncbi:MAG: hypothetical protein JW839_01695 [Candidatus Lokiarchaeota archaeon]|nr:hypothetical protein [Candidatus Lokiarchaeota archaeon]